MDLMRKVGGMMGQTSVAEAVAASSSAASSSAAAWIRCRRRRRLRLLPNLHTLPGHCCCSRMVGTRTGKKGGAVRGANRWKETGASPSRRAGPCSFSTVLWSACVYLSRGIADAPLYVPAVRWCSSCRVSVRPTRRHLLPSQSVRRLLLLSTMTARAMPAKKSSSSCCCCSS